MLVLVKLKVQVFIIYLTNFSIEIYILNHVARMIIDFLETSSPLAGPGALAETYSRKLVKPCMACHVKFSVTLSASG